MRCCCESVCVYGMMKLTPRQRCWQAWGGIDMQFPCQKGGRLFEKRKAYCFYVELVVFQSIADRHLNYTMQAKRDRADKVGVLCEHEPDFCDILPPHSTVHVFAYSWSLSFANDETEIMVNVKFALKQRRRSERSEIESWATSLGFCGNNQQSEQERERSHFNTASEQNQTRRSRWSPVFLTAAAAAAQTSSAALCQLTQQSLSPDSGQLLNAASLMITSTVTTWLISRSCSLAPLTAEQHWLPVNKHWQLLDCCIIVCGWVCVCGSRCMAVEVGRNQPVGSCS